MCQTIRSSCQVLLIKATSKRRGISAITFTSAEILKRMLSFNSPNKTESKLFSVLDKCYPNEWKYVGDGSFVINGKNPDFINCNGKKLIIELFGEHWHDKDEEEPRKEIFKQFGYETLIIWANELRHIDELKTKLNKFIEEYKYVH